MCLGMGLYTPGTVVHHKIFLSPDNIGNPDITLGWGNLMLLCADHHAEAHRQERRYAVDADGHVIIARQ